MKILIVSDAWFPQINGVVRTLSTTKQVLENLGHEVRLITPDLFRTIPCPTYPEIRLAYTHFGQVGKLIDHFQPDSIHIATEGPLGLSARAYCRRKNKAFTTSFHTKFPDYIHARFGVPIGWTYQLLRWFHRRSAKVMVTTQSMAQELAHWGFENLTLWSRGVDTELFRPRSEPFLTDLPRPLMVYVGRVAVEKNIEAFLQLNVQGSKVVVGAGPQIEYLQQRYPDVHFVGMKKGEELARYYAAADVFVFPSKTDTFGLVLLEALASGTPVAAYPVAGPIDIIGGYPEAGILHEDLEQAVHGALLLNREKCRLHAAHYSWQACTQQFLENLHIITRPPTPTKKTLILKQTTIKPV